MNMFETRTMLPILADDCRAKSFLRDRYFGNVVNFDTEWLDIDIVGPGNRRMAPFVHPKIGGKTMEREGYSTKAYKAPEISPDMITTAEDFFKRAPGETIYNAKSPSERAAEQLGRDLADLDDIITRREEWMCSQALFTGQIEIKGDGYDEVLNYWPTEEAEKPVTTPAALWTADNADPLKDLEAVRYDMIKMSGINPVECIMGRNAWLAFREWLGTGDNAKFELDTIHVKLGEVDAQYMPNGLTYRGYFNEIAMRIYTYDDWYTDEDGTLKPFIPENDILIAGNNVRTTMAYGLVSLFRENGTAPTFWAGARIPDSWNQRKNPAGRVVQIKSRPLPIIHQIYGFHVLKPLG